jgi:uncharacterized phage protein (TIGR02218 family)
MPVLRTCSTNLAGALNPASGSPYYPIPYKADLFSLTTLSAHVYRWTTWDNPLGLVIGGNLFTAAPWFKPRGWKVSNTMRVETLEIDLLDASQVFLGSSGGFGGVGQNVTLRQAIVQGLFDGATCLYQRLFMPTPGDVTTLGTMDLFAGDVGKITNMFGATATISVRSKSSRLAVMAPRNTYQPGCIHTFCDAGCTLTAGTFTFSKSVGNSPPPTATVINCVGGSNPLFAGGTLTMTSGLANGEVRGIIAADATTVTLANPLSGAPAVGATFTLFQACDKRLSTCTSVYFNKVNYRGFPYVPPPDNTSPGQIIQ